MKQEVPAMSRRGSMGRNPEEVPLCIHRKAPLSEIQHSFLHPECRDLDSGVAEMKEDRAQHPGVRTGVPRLWYCAAHMSKCGASRGFCFPLS